MNNLGIDLKLWEETEAKESGEFENIELGGHETVIIKASLYTSPVTENTSLRICVDIAGNEKHKGYFKKQFDNNTLKDKKWSNNATRYLSLKKENLAYTKGFITSVEKSNPGFKFDTSKGWEQLNNLKIASVFGLEEFEKQDGTIGTSTKLVQFRSIDKLNEIKIPKVKLINGDFIDYEEYINRPKNNQIIATNEFEDVYTGIEIASDELPF